MNSRVSLRAGVDQAAAVAEAIAILRRDGVVVLDDLVDPALVERCGDEIALRYPDMARPDRERNHGPYEGRHCMPMLVEGSLGDPSLLVPRAVSHISAELLEPQYKVDSVGLLVSVPGAPDQKAHHDAWLYPKEGLDRLLPPFALAFAMPLVTMDEASGHMAFWRRSHRSPSTEPDGPHDFAPEVHPGSAILWDFRVLHYGLANRSPRPRPVIFTVLSREWWVEVQPPEATSYCKLQAARDVHDAFSPKWQRRFSRARLIDPSEQ